MFLKFLGRGVDVYNVLSSGFAYVHPHTRDDEEVNILI
jgi:hypothetical protein